MNAEQAHGMMPPSGAYRIAIVGCGPKGFYCFESLLRELENLCSQCRVEICIFEPSGNPGVGNVYDASQPDFLRMNFAAGKIDAWCRDSHSELESQSLRPTFLEWAETRVPSYAKASCYPPRRVIGQYLGHCFDNAMQSVPECIEVTVRNSPVDLISQTSQGWKVKSRDSVSKFDEVLIAVGHGGWRPARNINLDEYLSKGSSICADEVLFINSVFPVDQKLNSETIEPGTHVAIGGFSLTFIDAVLALTEGRGGKFVGDSTGVSYLPSGNEPRKIYPFSRTGRPMLAKPDVSKMDLPDELERFWIAERENFANELKRENQTSFSRCIWPQVLDVAQRALAIVRKQSGTTVQPQSNVLSWFQTWIGALPTSLNAYAAMKQSCYVASGNSQPDEAWALGETWRRLYKPIVDAISYGGLPADEWSRFRESSAEMERIAFGPPLENLQRLVALIEEGIVDLSQLTVAPSDDAVPAGEVLGKVERLIDATIASPHFHEGDSIIGRLLHSGYLESDTGSKAIKVDTCGQAIGASGNCVSGLSVVGRATEGWVLGNDTLSRTLHDYPERWAQRARHRIEIEFASKSTETTTCPAVLTTA